MVASEADDAKKEGAREVFILDQTKKCVLPVRYRPSLSLGHPDFLL